MKIGCKQNKILKRVGEGEEGGEEGVLSFLDLVAPGIKEHWKCKSVFKHKTQ
jgi:hypothetical protein